jgi:hypothetical protein
MGCWLPKTDRILALRVRAVKATAALLLTPKLTLRVGERAGKLRPSFDLSPVSSPAERTRCLHVDVAATRGAANRPRPGCSTLTLFEIATYR